MNDCYLLPEMNAHNPVSARNRPNKNSQKDLCILLPQHVRNLKIELVYIYVGGETVYDQYAERFIATYYCCPPNLEHISTIVCNRGLPISKLRDKFELLPHCRFLKHNNHGQDIGGFISAARHSQSDAILCLGANCYFHRAGWLERLLQAWVEHGPGIYCTSTSYEATVHFNTTGFLCARALLANYPYTMITKNDRYNFEHGKAWQVQGINKPDTEYYRVWWRSVYQQGYPVMLVTWDGVYPWWHWRSPLNILRRGDQSNLLIWWKHVDLYFNADPIQKAQWRRLTDNVTDPAYNIGTHQMA